MHRTQIVTPIVLTAVLTSQLGWRPTVEPSSQQTSHDEALTPAATPSGWTCVLPRHDPSVRAARSGEPTRPFASRVNPNLSIPHPQPGPVNTITGFGTGPGTAPKAEVAGTLPTTTSSDTYAVPLRAGQVFSATVRGSAGTLEVRDPNGVLVEGSSLDRSGSYPPGSPLLGGGNATVDHVAALTGTHTITIRRATKLGSTAPTPAAPTAAAPTAAADAPNASAADLARPTPTPTPAPVPRAPDDTSQPDLAIFQHPSNTSQKIVLEFGGATIDTRRFGVETAHNPVTLSPLKNFLAGL